MLLWFYSSTDLFPSQRDNNRRHNWTWSHVNNENIKQEIGKKSKVVSRVHVFVPLGDRLNLGHTSPYSHFCTHLLSGRWPHSSQLEKETLLSFKCKKKINRKLLRYSFGEVKIIPCSIDGTANVAEPYRVHLDIYFFEFKVFEIFYFKHLDRYFLKFKVFEIFYFKQSC